MIMQARDTKVDGRPHDRADIDPNHPPDRLRSMSGSGPAGSSMLIRRKRATLRRRVFAGMGLVASLIFLSLAFFFWQLTTLRGAIRDLKEQDDRLALALNTAYQASNMLVIVQEKTAERIPAIFVEEVDAALQALKARNDDLNVQVALLPEEDPMRDRIIEATEGLQNAINIAEGTIRHVEDENWPAAEIRAAVLLDRHSETAWHLYRLVSLAQERRVRAEIRANEAMRRMVTISAPPVVIATLLAAAAVFATTRSITSGLEQLSESARRLAVGHFEERVPVVRRDELGQVAHSFNMMADELQGLYAGLEQQVAERTADLERRNAQLEAAGRVAREAAAIRDTHQLLNATVALISERFGFYHAGIFLLDDRGEYALLQAASSEGGQRMLARGHKLKVGEVGIVGYAAGTGEPRIALDVGADAVFFDNPDLPDTRSEMGLPLKVRERVIGVLDVQSTQESAFSDEDVAILQTMADQLALAIDNARLLDQSQRALKEVQTLYREQLRDVWQARAASQSTTYRYTGVEVKAVSPSFTLDARANAAETETADLADVDRASGPDRLPDRLQSTSAASADFDRASAQLQGRARLTQQENGRRLVAPIRLRGQTLGEITLRQDPEDDPWSEDDFALVEDLSTQIGLALENARLLEETRERAEREQMIGQMTTRFARSLDLDTLLQTAVQELGQLPHVTEVSVHVGSAEAPPPRTRDAPSEWRGPQNGSDAPSEWRGPQNGSGESAREEAPA